MTDHIYYFLTTILMIEISPKITNYDPNIFKTFNDTIKKIKTNNYEVSSFEDKEVNAQKVKIKTVNEFISAATVNKISINIDQRALRETKYWFLEWYEYFFGNSQENKIQVDPRKKNIISPKTSKVISSTTYKSQNTNDFVQGVLLILFTMFMATAMVLMYVLVTPAVKKLLEDGGWAILIPALMLCALYCGVVCANPRQSSCALIFLYFEVFTSSAILSQITSQWSTYNIYYGVIASTIVVFVCLLLAYTDFNLSSWILHVIVIGSTFVAIAVIALVVFQVTHTCIEHTSLTNLVIGTLIHVEMLIIHLQLILSGESLKLNETDYSLGAFLLYISIIIIPLKIVLGIALKLTHEERYY
ncbi:uncharacterized protein LOC115452137 [Manduca sexta]|uniref:uncharacterized protein LOC115452137 n=1 Tax=Manduca sexta TaxID=7130 RepID=UPI00188E2FAD|nr:uncharacterized protein LOC115452137 [Manduca sexta]